MATIKFICEKCGKELVLETRVFEKAYKGKTTCLSCRGEEHEPK